MSNHHASPPRRLKRLRLPLALRPPVPTRRVLANHLANAGPPMLQITVHKAKSTLSDLLKRVEAGEEVVIMRGNVPVARLEPFHPRTPPRVFGALKGHVTVTPAFFEPLPEAELAGWE